MLYWKLRDLIGYAISASRDADFLEKIILTTPNVTRFYSRFGRSTKSTLHCTIDSYLEIFDYVILTLSTTGLRFSKTKIKSISGKVHQYMYIIKK